MAKSEFVYTIQDDDNVADLDTEKGNEMNPVFQFDGDGPASPIAGGWDFGAESEDSDGLDDIIRKHGGLQDERPEPESSDEDDENDDLVGEEEEETLEREQNDQDEQGDEDPGAEQKEDQTSKDAEPESNTVMNDRSGFFDTTASDSKSVDSFAELSLSRPILKGIAKLGYTKPTPIQSAVIPVALLGKDIVAGAVTGSGKTAAYMIPTLERLLYRSQKTAATRVVVLTPTRELALQVCDVGKKLGSFVSNLRFGVAVGGLNLRAQEQELKTRPDIVVATPGRFIDHVRNSPSFSVDTVEVLIIDEADRMLEEGFETELNEILSLIPTKRQTLLFSATMNSSIKDLIKLSLHRPVRIMIDPPKQAASGLVQEFVRIRKHEDSRPAVLVSLLRKLNRNQRVIVFVSRKHTAHYLRVVVGLLGIQVGELHGSLTQDQRVKSVTAFKDLKVPILICTDLASRGLDIPKIEVVINYELPSSYEVYLHRVGRTARAGRSGTSISLVGDSPTERQVVRAAINSANTASNTSTSKQTILGRNVDWKEVDAIKHEIESKKDVIQEVLSEEKTAKELAMAERDVKRVQNMMDHKQEIQSRPKRTWFEGTASQVREGIKKRKRTEKKDNPSNNDEKRWAYKKTRSDRDANLKKNKKKATSRPVTRSRRSKS